MAVVISIPKYTVYRIKSYGGAGRPLLPTIFERKMNRGRLYIILKGINRDSELA